jgi:hypothetical protein
MKTRNRLLSASYWICIILLAHACKSGDKNPAYCIQQGDFKATLTETGELLAVNARSVLMPYIGWKYGWQFKITGLAEHGSEVHVGDSVAQVDPANVQKFLLEQENLLEVEKANLTKLLVEQTNKSHELEARLREVQADYNLKKLELERYQFESERKQEIKELEFSQAKVHMNRITRSIELEKVIALNSRKIQEIKVAQIDSNIKQARDALGKLTVLSPLDGIFQVSKNRRTQKLYRVGDDTYQGAELALVPDLQKIKVKSTINEADIGKVKAGQKVVVRLEAFPDRPFPGTLTEVGKLSHNKEEDSKVKVFDTVILLEEADPVLKPGMTVSCEIIYAELKNALFVDNKCLKKEDGQYYIQMKEQGSRVEKPVEIGPRNNRYTVIYGDLEKGTELMIPEISVVASLQ